MSGYPFVREELRRAYHELRGGQLSPARGALALGLGVFVGSLPIFGLHTPIVVALCLWLRLDALVAWAGSNVSNPLFAPALLASEAAVGAYLRRGALPRPGAFTRLDALDEVGRDLVVGAPVVGLGLGAASFAVTFVVLLARRRWAPASERRAPYRLRDDAPAWVAAVERLAHREGRSDSPHASERARFHRARLALLTDPLVRALGRLAGESAGSFGDVVVVGDEPGRIARVLEEMGVATSVRAEPSLEDAAASLPDGGCIFARLPRRLVAPSIVCLEAAGLTCEALTPGRFRAFGDALVIARRPA